MAARTWWLGCKTRAFNSSFPLDPLVQAAEAASAAGASQELAAAQQRCKELEKKFAVARKKIQVGRARRACCGQPINGMGLC